MASLSPEKQAKMMEMLAKQHQLMSDFLETTKKQKEILDEEDTDADSFLAAVEKRQAIIDEAEAFRAELEGLLAEYLALKPGDAREEQERQSVLEARAKTRGLMLEIRELDQANQQLATKRREFFRSKRTQARQTKKGVTAYVKSGEIIGEGGDFFDEQK